MIIWFLFNLLMCFITLTNVYWRFFGYLGVILFMIYNSVFCCIWLASTLLRIFVSMFISDTGLSFFLVYFSVFFLSLVWWYSCRMSLGIFLPFQFSGRVRRVGMKHSVNVWWNLPVSPSGLALLFDWRQLQFQYLWFFCWYLLFICFSFRRLNLSKSLLLHGCQDYCYIIAYSNLFKILCSFVVSIVTSFTFVILLIWILSFFYKPI